MTSQANQCLRILNIAPDSQVLILRRTRAPAAQAGNGEYVSEAQEQIRSDPVCRVQFREPTLEQGDAAAEMRASQRPGPLG